MYFQFSYFTVLRGVCNSHEDSGDCGQCCSDTDVSWTRCLGLSLPCWRQVLIWLAIGFGLELAS